MLHPVTTHKRTAQPRLWFTDSDHDLFVWLDQSGQPAGFQFSYNKKHGYERLLQWMVETGYSHDRVDSGEKGGGRYKMTPVTVPDGKVNIDELAERFRNVSQNIQEDIARFVYEKIKNYPDVV